jgi:GNAT superfamily N-acetyltransferase
MNSPEIRPALAGDLTALLALVEQYWAFETIDGFDRVRVGENLERLLADERLGRVWLAQVAGVPVGYLLVVFMFSLEFGGLCAEIDELYVSDAHRGQRLGARLLETAEAELRRLGCPGVALQIGRGNEAARRFYRQRGFEPREGYDLLTKML